MVNLFRIVPVCVAGLALASTATFALAGCVATPPTATQPAPKVEVSTNTSEPPLSLQGTQAAAEVTRIYGEAFAATEARRLTQQAVDDGQTATAFPLAMTATASAATATALPVQITQAAIVENATQAAIHTQQANAQATSTAYAGVVYSITATHEAEGAANWQRAGRSFSELTEAGAVGIFWLFVIVVLGLSIAFGFMFSVHTWRNVTAPRVIANRLWVQKAGQWTDVTPIPALARLEAPKSEGAPINLAPWKRFYREVFELSKQFDGLGWRKKFQLVMEPDDWRICIKEPLVATPVAVTVNYGGSESCNYAPDWNADMAIGWLEGGNLPPLPYVGTPPVLRSLPTGYSENRPKQDSTAYQQAQQV